MKMKMTTDIPPEITTPDSVETRLGTLIFFDGFPGVRAIGIRNVSLLEKEFASGSRPGSRLRRGCVFLMRRRHWATLPH